VVYMVATVLLSHGKTYMVESDKPIEDIVAVCDWVSATRGLHGGTHSVTTIKPHVIKSGEEFSCGFNWMAWLNISFKSSASFMHPTYRIEHKEELESGLKVRIAKSKLDILDEQQTKYETGEWGDNQAYGTRYVNSIQYVCGFPHQYVKYYLKAHGVIDVDRFIDSYDLNMFQCVDRVYEVMNKHYRGFSKNSDARITINMQWDKLR